MKIIEGFLKAKIIPYKEQSGTRVTSDKVRKAIFDVLKNMIDIKGKKVADIFCGSGMFGIESISRGAGRVFFIDESRSVVDALKKNIKILDISYCGIKMINKKFESFIKTCDEKFDLIFADPPYYKFDFSKFNDIYKILNKKGIFVLESSKRLVVGDLNNLQLILEKNYGDTIVRFYRIK
uniref:Methyltransferase domain-containing protein n=1 Tax=candidate division CPR3 bacterium TaxID=2268181 RepID=A0A7C4M1P3_UNCC3